MVGDSLELARKARDLTLPRSSCGSSLPVTWRLPATDLPLGCKIEEALMVGEGASDAMDFHALEGLQCMVERRRGGETGVDHLPDLGLARGLRPVVDGPVVRRTPGALFIEMTTGPAQVERVD